MFQGILDRLARRTPEQQARDAVVATPDSTGVLIIRHESLLQRAIAQKLDPGTLLRLIQTFGPLMVALLELWLKLAEARRT